MFTFAVLPGRAVIAIVLDDWLEHEIDSRAQLVAFQLAEKEKIKGFKRGTSLIRSRADLPRRRAANTIERVQHNRITTRSQRAPIGIRAVTRTGRFCVCARAAE